MKIFGDTDIGKRRANNQDSFRVKFYGEETALCLVCDGMGGAQGGAQASSTASDVFMEEADGFMQKVSAGDTPTCEDFFAALVSAAEAANTAVYTRAKNDASLSGMGTTLVGALITDGKAYAVNVGDSRMYLLRGETAEQITHDHSYVQYLVDLGKMSYEESLTSSVRNIITRAVGIDNTVEADTFEIALQAGDRLLLCSDGLTGHIRAADFEKYTGDTAKETVRKLIDAANDAGGSDNITAVIAEI